jgi:hypothetical protein
MSSSGILRRVAVVGTGASEARIASIIRAKRISELRIELAVTSIAITFIFYLLLTLFLAR